MVKKILILGISGTGKTFLSDKLSKLLDIPVYHLDKYIWKENWVEASQEELRKNVLEIVSKDKWIIEGWISPLAAEKIVEADMVLYLDYSGFRAVFGGIKRWWKNRGRVRREMPAGCIEKFDYKYLKVMFKRLERPEIEEAIKPLENKIIRVISPRNLRNIIDKLDNKCA